MMKEKISSKLKHAFSIKQEPLEIKDFELIEKAVNFIIKRNLQSPVILVLESLRPLSFIGSQGLVIIGPYLDPFLTLDEQNRLVEILEHREGIELFINKIEEMQP